MRPLGPLHGQPSLCSFFASVIIYLCTHSSLTPLASATWAPLGHVQSFQEDCVRKGKWEGPTCPASLMPEPRASLGHPMRELTDIQKERQVMGSKSTQGPFLPEFPAPSSTLLAPNKSMWMPSTLQCGHTRVVCSSCFASPCCLLSCLCGPYSGSPPPPQASSPSPPATCHSDLSLYQKRTFLEKFTFV